MKKNDKIFIGIIIVIVAMIAGLVVENAAFSRKSMVVASFAPTPRQKKIDTSKLKAAIEKAGLVPREAKHWKIIND